MAAPVRDYTKQLPSGVWRVAVRAGSGSLTGKPIRLRAIAKTWERAQAELTRWLEEASAGRRLDSDATVGELLKQYAAVAGLGSVHPRGERGVHPPHDPPGLCKLQLRKVRGPVLDSFYARLRRCRDPLCTGKPFTDHSAFPELVVNRSDPRPAWRQVADTVREAVTAGQLVAGDRLPSVREVADQQGVRTSTSSMR